jgi:hypothetical protein
MTDFLLEVAINKPNNVGNWYFNTPPTAWLLREDRKRPAYVGAAE